MMVFKGIVYIINGTFQVSEIIPILITKKKKTKWILQKIVVS